MSKTWGTSRSTEMVWYVGTQMHTICNICADSWKSFDPWDWGIPALKHLGDTAKRSLGAAELHYGYDTGKITGFSSQEWYISHNLGNRRFNTWPKCTEHFQELHHGKGDNEKLEVVCVMSESDKNTVCSHQNGKGSEATNNKIQPEELGSMVVVCWYGGGLGPVNFLSLENSRPMSKKI